MIGWLSANKQYQDYFVWQHKRPEHVLVYDILKLPHRLPQQVADSLLDFRTVLDSNEQYQYCFESCHISVVPARGCSRLRQDCKLRSHSLNAPSVDCTGLNASKQYPSYSELQHTSMVPSQRYGSRVLLDKLQPLFASFRLD